MLRQKFYRKVSVLLVALLLLPSIVTAAAADEPKEVEQGGVIVESERYEYDNYVPVTDVSGDWNPFTIEEITKAGNWAVEATFGINKLFAELIDYGLENLYAISIVNNLADEISTVSDSVWEALKDNFAPILLILAALQIFGFYVGQRNGSRAGQATFKLILVFMVSVVWFSQSDYFLKTLNNVSNEVQGIVMSAGTGLSDESVNEGEELEGSQAILRNHFFDRAVMKPYLLMNYGTADEAKINEDNENRIEDLLKLNVNEDGVDERQDIATEEVNDLNNQAMSDSNLGKKLAIAFVSIFFTVLLGVPLLLISMLNLILQMVALAIAIVLPISFLISMLPSFSNSGWYTLGRLVGVFLIKIFVGILVLFAFVIMQTMDTMIPSNSMGGYMLNTLTIAILLILMIKFRNKIIEFITAGRVQSVDSQMASRAYDKAVRQPRDKAIEMTKQVAARGAMAAAGGAGAAAAAGGRAFDKASLRTGESTVSGVKNALGRFRRGKGEANSLQEARDLNRTPQEATGTDGQPLNQGESNGVVDMAKFKQDREAREAQRISQQHPSADQQRAGQPGYNENGEPITPNGARPGETVVTNGKNLQELRNGNRTPQRPIGEGEAAATTVPGSSAAENRTDTIVAGGKLDRSNRSNQAAIGRENPSTSQGAVQKRPEGAQKQDNQARESRIATQHNKGANRSEQQQRSPQSAPKVHPDKPITQWEANQQLKQRQEQPSKQVYAAQSKRPVRKPPEKGQSKAATQTKREARKAPARPVANKQSGARAAKRPAKATRQTNRPTKAARNKAPRKRR